MRRVLALIVFLLQSWINVLGFEPGVDGPVTNQEALEGGNTVLQCDTETTTPNDELMLLVWYKNEIPIYSYDARVHIEWASDNLNTSGRIVADLKHEPALLTISQLSEEDQGLYHCRAEFLLSPTRNHGINLIVAVVPSLPFFSDEFGNKVEKQVGPYHLNDTLVLTCLVIGGRPPPHVLWYSGDTLVDASDGVSEGPGVRENELFLPLTREHNAPLSCRASNTKLAPPLIATLHVELYLPAENVNIEWVEGIDANDTLESGRRATVLCRARGSYPILDLAWWLDHRHLTQYSNQTWIKETNTAISYLEFTPSRGDNGATLSCVATNPLMAPSRGSKADVITLNVAYSPVVEVVKIGDGKINESIEFDILHLECEIKANPTVDNVTWYFNDSVIPSNTIWGNIDTTSSALIIKAATRNFSGRFSCGAANRLGNTRSPHLVIHILYPPECSKYGITLIEETLSCNVKAFPAPDTFLWHILVESGNTQQLTTGSAILPLSMLLGSLAGPMKVTCEAGNGIGNQELPCESTFSLAHLRPLPPKQCDLAYEDSVFQIRCIPVENATHYEVSVWRMSASNSSLVLERRGAIGNEEPSALANSINAAHVNIWLVRGALGQLRPGDEAGASACNRYGCSRDIVLRPADSLLQLAAPPWWQCLFEKDVGIPLGAALLVAAFVLSTLLLTSALRRKTRNKTPVIQVLQLEDVARGYIDNMENKRHAGCSARSCSVRSCSSGYSGGSLDSEPPAIDRLRKPPVMYWEPGPPPDVTLTLHRESAV